MHCKAGALRPLINWTLVFGAQKSQESVQPNHNHQVLHYPRSVVVTCSYLAWSAVSTGFYEFLNWCWNKFNTWKSCTSRSIQTVIKKTLNPNKIYQVLTPKQSNTHPCLFVAPKWSTLKMPETVQAHINVTPILFSF